MKSSELIKNIDDAATWSPTALEQRERLELLAACEKLKGAFESPFDATVRITFGVHQAVALRIAIEMKIFDTAAKAHGDKVDIEQLSAATCADQLLTTRVMRMLVGMGMFKETEDSAFTATPLAGAYVTGSPLNAAVVHEVVVAEILSRLPEYLEENDFQSPGDAYKGPFQHAMGTELHYFEWLKSRPRDQVAFNTLMAISRMNRGEEWYNFYPVEAKLRVSGGEPLLVDIGGGLGHDLIAFRNHFPKLPGKLIVQDLPIVIDDIQNLPSDIEAMEHDFFTPQPIKHARAYYLRTVLHDWPDEQARQILKNIRSAMGQESILLINENALPKSNVPLYPAMVDMQMMALFASLDRTETQFTDLLTSAGFKVVQIWKPKVLVPGAGTLFEAVLGKESG